MANTGWTWHEAGTLTIPRLRALLHEWAQRPPMHVLMKARMGYQGPKPESPETTPQAPATGSDDTALPAWAAGLGGAIPASQAVSQATTTQEALAAFEQQFFGTIQEVPRHGR